MYKFTQLLNCAIVLCCLCQWNNKTRFHIVSKTFTSLTQFINSFSSVRSEVVTVVPLVRILNWHNVITPKTCTFKFNSRHLKHIPEKNKLHFVVILEFRLFPHCRPSTPTASNTRRCWVLSLRSFWHVDTCAYNQRVSTVWNLKPHYRSPLDLSWPTRVHSAQSIVVPATSIFLSSIFGIYA